MCFHSRILKLASRLASGEKEKEKHQHQLRKIYERAAF